MIVLKELFQTNADFVELVPGISGQTELRSLNAPAISARKQIMDLISRQIWTKICAEKEDSELRIFLAVAFGNLTMFKGILFQTVKNRLGSEKDVYKYELEGMRRDYVNNYYDAMDSIIERLLSEDDYEEDWGKTGFSTLLKELKIDTMAEFNSFYGIDSSYLFFYRSLPLQREVLMDGLSEYFTKCEDLRPELLPKMKLILCHLVVALAIERFDIIELPATLRNLFDEQKASRSGSDERSSLNKLALSLRDKANDTLSALDAVFSGTESESVDTNFNRPDDKIILMA